uniref:BACK domain-containing protein n=1 Tax=Wuchereria bancrofti TaxID=6293 RepID=A0AAF5PVY0_WUCBA
MTTDGNTKARITNSILGDMTEIAYLLEMESLLEKIDKFILISITQNEQFLVHTLAMISVQLLLDTTLGRKVIDIAVSKFQIIRKMSSFNDVPLDAMLRILDRCDLNISNEFDVVETAISWLAAKPERIHFSHLILRCVRVVNLTPNQRSDLFTLTKAMPKYAQIMSAFVHYTFNNTNAYRVCVLAEHNSYKRCGTKIDYQQFIINVPSRKILYRRKAPPIKSSYITAKPKVSPSQVSDDKKSEVISEGKDMKRSIFSISQKRRTTRAERRQKRNTMPTVTELTKEKKDIVNKNEKDEKKASKDGNDKTTKGSKNKQSKSQRKTAGSSPESEDRSTYYKSNNTRSVTTSSDKSSDYSSETDQSSSITSTTTDKSELRNK